MRTLAADIGGTQTRVGLVEDGHIRARRTFPTQGVKATIAVLKDLTPANCEAVGVAFAGSVDMPSGRVVKAPNLGVWEGLEVRATLQEALGLPVFVANDASCAALGERVAGAKARDFVYITWSTGIGGGIVCGGEVVWGARGMAGEIGHMVLRPEGPLCGCGKRGCLEAIASGSGMARRAERELGTHLDTKELVERALSGDASAKMIVDDACAALGQGLAILAELLEPEVFVLGGGVSQAWPQLGPRVRAATSRLARVLPEIVLTSLGDEIGLHGAAALPDHFPAVWRCS